jgi:hypothetical protein
MIGIPIKQDGVIPVHKLDENEVKELIKYSHTEYK